MVVIEYLRGDGAAIIILKDGLQELVAVVLLMVLTDGAMLQKAM